jgi:glycosyltransferase involved in cell wall biosynthesis
MTDAKKPLITLVIPTRERANTLKFTLETALDQANNNFQIIVSDNFSQDNTREVVEAFSDSRITYVNTGGRLSMCDNWDFALKHVRGEYVIYIGDDDGLMPGAINKLEAMINNRPCPIYFWQCHDYFWPIEEIPAEIVSIIPVQSPYEVDLHRLLRFSLRWGGLRGHLLPCAYHGAVSLSILIEIRKKTGRVFHSQAPDLFTAYALPVFSDRAVNVGEALTVHGRSGKSNSGVTIAKEGDTNWLRYLQEYESYRVHPTLFPGAPYVLNLTQDSVLVAMDLFPEFFRGTRFNYEAMWARMLRIVRADNKLGTNGKKFDSLFGLIRKRRQIRVYHPLRVSHLLFYGTINVLLELRARLRKKIWSKKIDLYANDCPQDIQGFVKLAVQLQIKIKS